VIIRLGIKNNSSVRSALLFLAGELIETKRLLCRGREQQNGAYEIDNRAALAKWSPWISPNRGREGGENIVNAPGTSVVSGSSKIPNDQFFTILEYW
jgi:hypothetical protein